MLGSPALVTRVLTAAESLALVSLADVKLELKISGGADDAWLMAAIQRVSQWIAGFCGRVFQVQTYRDEIWPERDPYPWQVPGGLPRLQLSSWPIVSIASVTENGEALMEGTGFEALQQTGQLLRLSVDGYPWRWPPLPIVVEYQAGYASIPHDLQDAAIRLVKMRWYARDRDPALREENVQGVYSAQYWFGSGPGGPADMPNDVAAMLERNYRVPVIA